MRGGGHRPESERTMNTDWNAREGRWFVDGEPVHAGNGLEMQGCTYRYDDGQEIVEPGEWFEVRLESRDVGRQLDAYVVVHGVTFCHRSVCGFADGEPYAARPLRWPVTP